MRRLLILSWLCVLSLPLTAQLQAVYQGGTLASVQAGASGNLITGSDTVLRFESAQGSSEIPYSGINHYQYSQDVARHLGVLPAVAVGLVRKRQRIHVFRFWFRDEKGVMQVAIFEVPKQAPPTLRAILQARAPQACERLAICNVRPATSHP